MRLELFDRSDMSSDLIQTFSFLIAIVSEFGIDFPKTQLSEEVANGERYPLVGGTRKRHFDGTNLKPQKLLENAQTPTSRVHALLGAFLRINRSVQSANNFLLAKIPIDTHTICQCG
jgi:hypothetical protein